MDRADLGRLERGAVDDDPLVAATACRVRQLDDSRERAELVERERGKAAQHGRGTAGQNGGPLGEEAARNGAVGVYAAVSPAEETAPDTLLDRALDVAGRLELGAADRSVLACGDLDCAPFVDRSRAGRNVIDERAPRTAFRRRIRTSDGSFHEGRRRPAPILAPSVQAV